jgi:hypothetical protein
MGGGAGRPTRRGAGVAGGGGRRRGRALPNGDIAVADQGFTFGRPAVLEVNKSAGARTLISGRGQGSGPAL